MSNLKFLEKLDENNHYIKFVGNIDEDSVFLDLNLMKAKKIFLNFNEVEGINSCGIREWVKLMSTVPQASLVVCDNCKKEIIDQVNMIDGFFPSNTFIRSFYIPYYCENCNSQTDLLVSKKNNNEKLDEPEEEIACKNCGKNAEIDIIESKYFKFLKK